MAYQNIQTKVCIFFVEVCTCAQGTSQQRICILSCAHTLHHSPQSPVKKSYNSEHAQQTNYSKSFPIGARQNVASVNQGHADDDKIKAAPRTPKKAPEPVPVHVQKQLCQVYEIEHNVYNIKVGCQGFFVHIIICSEIKSQLTLDKGDHKVRDK